MQKTFDPQNIESKWYQTWEEAGYFKPSRKGEPYCIVIPPPNVTGTLHMGHGFQLSIMDTLIRYHRMSGFNTHWQVGTDHAGIATQLVVEKKLLDQGIKRRDLSREEFEKHVWQWKEISGQRITKQMRRLGASLDWQQERFTLDPGLCEAVQKVFIALYDEKLIYRGSRLVNWDPVLKTAVSDLEVNYEDTKGQIFYIRYPLVDQNAFITVATTRPETMFGDVALAVHPDDERYQKLIGQKVRLPLTDHIIPIIADESVVREFGTGCVKITPAHDFNDYALGQRHQLPQNNIFTEDACLNDNVPPAYQGLERFKARDKVLADLKTSGLLEKIEPHQLSIPKGERSGAILEPFITPQWFVKTKPLADKAIEALRKNAFRFIPENWDKTYLGWLENITDWCISRQLWWGHRIPAWYDASGNTYVAHNEKEVRSKYNLDETVKLTQDQDVLDTWFSAALWPFSSLGWPEETYELKTFYPTNVLVTGFDIIFFWVARMVMMGLKFTGEVPFKDVYITGLIRDSKGQKMSKSKGNILDPLDLIDGINIEDLVKQRTSNLLLSSQAAEITKATYEEFPNGIPAFGTDALRFTFCALASTSRDINFDINRLEGYRSFCNKLWNAARYVLLNAKKLDGPISYSLADRWILSKFELLTQTVHESFKEYRFDLIAQSIYDFTWHEYCDFYLEFSKPILNPSNPDMALQKGTQKTLIEILEKLLRLIHPLMPFISEEIWQQVAPLAEINGATIMLQEYPKFSAEKIDNSAITTMEWLKQIIFAIRNIRGEVNVAANKKVPLLLKGAEENREKIAQIELYLKPLAKIETITWLEKNISTPKAASAIVGDLELLIPLSQIADLEAEKARIKKEIVKLEKDRAILEAKLDNAAFINKAPPSVVAEEKKRLQIIKNTLSTLYENEKN